MHQLTKNCLVCDKPLKGRIDKKFCDDYCRNNFNNKLNSDQTNYIRNINNILRKNRRILATILGDNTDFTKTNYKKLLEYGFSTKYHTHTYTNQKQQVYYFFYDYGYLKLDEENLLIVKRKEKL